MVLRPVRMAKVRIIGSVSKRDRILSALHDLGVMEVEEVGKEVLSVLRPGRNPEIYQKVINTLSRFRSYEAQLPAREVRGRKRFDSVEQVLAEADSLNIDQDLKILKQQESDILGNIRDIESRIEPVSAISDLNYDLGIFNGARISSYIAVPQGKDFDPSLLRETLKDSVIREISGGRILISIPREQEAFLGRVASESGIRLMHIPDMMGKTPSQYLEELNRKLGENRESLETVRKALIQLSENYYERVVQIREQLEIEARKMEAMEKQAASGDIFVLEGWVPERDMARVERVLDRVSNGSVIVSRVETDEVPPTLMDNPRRFRAFEFFVRFYSIPKEYEVDPTLIFALIFPVFFGLMVGDWGYGLVILSISLWLLHRLDHPPKKSHIPRSLSRFALTVFGPNALRTLARALIPGAAVAIVAGLLFNNFFGFPLLPHTVFAVSTGFGGAKILGFPPTPSESFSATVVIPKILLLAGYIGLAMVTFGLLLGIANSLFIRERRHAVGKAGWILLAWGIAVIGLDLIHHNLSFSLPTGLVNIICLGLIVVGLALIIVFEGALSAIELPSIISHILSYTRLVGILLASVILAQVIDIIFIKGVDKSVGLAVAGVIILVLGQIFNLAIAIFEPGIQGARLLYVEFFSKFFQGNGRVFRPFGIKRRYTLNQVDEAEAK